jgi:phosphate transport system protein
MREVFERELTQVGSLLVTMSDLVSDAIATATTALLESDRERAERVIAADSAIDAIQDDIDARCLEVLALQAPVATDLRVVVTALRIGATLERMGDLACHIAKQARMRYPNRGVPEALLPTFAEMGLIATRLSEDAGRVIATRDLELAKRIPLQDDRMDELHKSVFSTLLDESWPADARATVDVTLCSRYFERFGDHAVSVAGRMQFLVTGQIAESAGSQLATVP